MKNENALDLEKYTDVQHLKKANAKDQKITLRS